MTRMKVMTIVGTRPELIKLSRVIAELEQHTQHILVHSGQNFDYELNEIFFKELEIKKPDYFLDAARETSAATIACVIEKADEIFAKEQPDALLIYGDTNTSLAAIPAKRRQIPIFHMEAGNRCFDDRVPEEINRRIIDHISDINMPLTEHGRRYLIKEGIKPETIIKTGSCMKEVITYYRPKIDDSIVLSTLGLKTKDYFLVSAHREENVDVESRLKEFLKTLFTLVETYNKTIIVSTHPRTRDRLEKLIQGSQTFNNPKIHFLKPFGLIDYIKLQENAFCVLSDSGTITEESSLLNFPALNLRDAHERPEGMDVGALIMTGLNADKIIPAVKVVTQQHSHSEPREFPIAADYNVANVSKKVLRIIMSYTPYVNRTVWYKTS
jgi:UDP-N-acetylglucosamine 2-epimerase (non-hydrolysing)